MELDCYKIHATAPELLPGNQRREWMDAFQSRHPYRCLPLTMANTTGWDILCPHDVTIEWDGGPMEENIKITSTAGDAAAKSLCVSHFRRGIVTFHTGYLFKTQPGWAVWCSGPPNWPKDGVYPLSGLIETDWLPFPFTMNWQMTRPGRVTFEKGEPFCFITLMEHNRLEAVTPRVKTLDATPDLKQEYEAWNASRTDFNKRLNDREELATKAGWQKHYMRGEKASGGDGGPDHKSKRKLQMPVQD